MTRDNKKALIPRPSTEIEGGNRRKSPVNEEKTRDDLAQAEVRGDGQARFQISDYVLREPDYKQILQWAGALNMEPEEVLKHLTQSSLSRFNRVDTKFAVEDGAIVSLIWDLHRLPLVPETWQTGLIIRKLTLVGLPDDPVLIGPRLSRLTYLDCSGKQLIELDLSQVPELTKLNCGNTQLTELNLAPVPGLTSLRCFGNQLTELDLSSVQGLTYLWCSSNKLTELDLSQVPGLTYLHSYGNQLTELDLSAVQKLKSIRCDKNVRLCNMPANLSVRRV